MEFLTQNWWYLLLVAGFAFMMFRRGGCCGGHANSEHNNMAHGGGGGCCGGGDSHKGHNHMGYNEMNGHNDSNQMNKQIEMVLDTICGMHVNPETAIKQTIDGKTYYFCSENCRAEFVRKQR